MAEDTRNPTSDDAASGTWTGSAGSRFGVVDDYPDTTGADEITHGTTAGNLTFGFGAFSVPTGSTSISVLVDYYDYKNGSQGSNIGARLKIGGTYHNAATHNPANGSANRTQRTDTFATNPKTAAAWTVDDVNGTGANPLQAFGWVSTDASPTVTLSSIRIRVSYTPLAERTGSGSTTAGAQTSSGAGTVTVSGSGATSASAQTDSGTGTTLETRSGSGASAATAAMSSGSGAVRATGSGGTVASAAQCSGSGTVEAGGPPGGNAQRSGRRMSINRGGLGL